MTTGHALFVTNEIITLGGQQYGGAYGDMHVQGGGVFEFYVRGQRLGRMDYVIESVNLAHGDTLDIFYRIKSSQPFLHLGQAIKFEIIRQHLHIGHVVPIGDMAFYRIVGIKQEGIIVCPWQLNGDTGPGCAKRAAVATLGHQWNQVFPQTFMQCFYRWSTTV